MASSSAMSRSLVRPLVLVGALVASAVYATDPPASDPPAPESAAVKLPPQEAAPYTAVYRHVRSANQAGGLPPIEAVSTGPQC